MRERTGHVGVKLVETRQYFRHALGRNRVVALRGTASIFAELRCRCLSASLQSLRCTIAAFLRL